MKLKTVTKLIAVSYLIAGVTLANATSTETQNIHVDTYQYDMDGLGELDLEFTLDLNNKMGLSAVRSIFINSQSAMVQSSELTFFINF
jgi:hypothetical protein